MKLLYVHQTYPGQFGHLAEALAARPGFDCTFLSCHAPGTCNGVRKVQYKPRGGPTLKTHSAVRFVENAAWHAQGIYEAARTLPRPDLIVNHGQLGPALFLRELWPDVPVLSYFEYFFRPHNSERDFRPDFPEPEQSFLDCRFRNASALLALDDCDAGYAPTHWQHSLVPRPYQDKVEVVHDGIDTRLWRPGLKPSRIGNFQLPDGRKFVTYAARGMEPLRGFDVFMKAAREVCRRRKDVLFLVAGDDRVCYSGDESGRSFKDRVLAEGGYDLSRFVFLGHLPPQLLADLFRAADCHVYLTVPFVLSWSLLNALACGAVVLASRAPPVEEIIRDGQTGLLRGFFDVQGFADALCAVLDRPEDHRHLGAAGAELIRTRFSLDALLGKHLDLYEKTINHGRKS
jgi:glycosyltransferase involved in cell wall biosynthesis